MSEKLGSGRDADPAPEVSPARQAEAARAICLRLLTGSPKTRRQLSDALARRGVADEVAAPVLDRLTDVGLIDDAAFARAWVTSRQSGRGLARRALSAELRRRGVDRDVADGAVETIDADMEEQAARDLICRRLRTLGQVAPATATRRMVGLLARRGYSEAVAYRLVREELGDAQLDRR